MWGSGLKGFVDGMIVGAATGVSLIVEVTVAAEEVLVHTGGLKGWKRFRGRVGRGGTEFNGSFPPTDLSTAHVASLNG